MSGKVMQMHEDMVTVSKFLSPVPCNVLQWNTVTRENAIERGREFFSPLLTITEEPRMAFDVPALTITPESPSALLAATTPGPSDVRDAEIARLAQELRHERARVVVLERENELKRTAIERLRSGEELRLAQKISKEKSDRYDRKSLAFTEASEALDNVVDVLEDIVKGCVNIATDKVNPQATRNGIRLGLAEYASRVQEDVLPRLPTLAKHLERAPR